MKTPSTKIALGIALVSAYTFSLYADHRTTNNLADTPFYVAGDYLFWKTEEDQAPYAINIPGGLTGDGLVFADKLVVKNQTTTSHSGVRAQAGYYFKKHWDVRATFTHFKQCAFNCFSDAPFSMIATAIFGLIDNFFGTGAQSKWFLNLNAADVDVAQTRLPFSSLSLRPFIGFKWARINQLQDITYFGLDNLGVEVKKYNCFSGIGPRIGIDEKFYFWEYFTFVGCASAALLYGKLATRTPYTVTTDETTLTPTFIECKKRLRPMMQLLVGLGFEKESEHALFEVVAGYEAQYWWNQWQALPSLIGLIAAGSSQGDLMMHGLMLRLGIKI
jgi:hypothetical protein